MKIKIKKTTEQEVEISLPAFKKETGLSYVAFVKLEEDRRTEITLYNKKKQFHLMSFDGSPEPHLDESFGNCTEQEFEEALKEAVQRSANLSQSYVWHTPEKITELEKVFQKEDL